MQVRPYAVRLLPGYREGNTRTCTYPVGYGLDLVPAGYSDPGTLVPGYFTFVPGSISLAIFYLQDQELEL